MMAKTQTGSPSDAVLARALAEKNTEGSLSTVAKDHEGHPFGSVMPYVLDPTGHPILLASRLAEHTSNFEADQRASLMISESIHSRAADDPLALQRVTLLGLVRKIDGADVKEMYIARHPYASMYVDFDDFSFYRLTVQDVRYVGGFGRMSWVTADDFLSADVPPELLDTAATTASQH